jgi:hypothetical protein
MIIDTLFNFNKTVFAGWRLTYILIGYIKKSGLFPIVYQDKRVKSEVLQLSQSPCSQENTTDVLNSLGVCYYEIGDKKQAILAWEKSLEVNSDQEKIEKLIDAVKKEINDYLR